MTICQGPEAPRKWCRDDGWRCETELSLHSRGINQVSGLLKSVAGELGEGGTRLAAGPCSWHLLQKENTLGAITALHKKQMVLTTPWAAIPRGRTHSCVSEKFARKPCSAPQSHQQLCQVTPALPVGMLRNKPSTHSIPLLIYQVFIFPCCCKLHFDGIFF